MSASVGGPKANEEPARPAAGFLLALAIGAVVGTTGCGGPFLVFPGGALSGSVVEEPVGDWSFVSDRFLELETRPDDPYSVQLNYVVREGQLYIDPAEGRAWLEHLRADPRARVRFGANVYPVTAILVSQPSAPVEGFEADRYVYRLDSR